MDFGLDGNCFDLEHFVVNKLTDAFGGEDSTGGKVFGVLKPVFLHAFNLAFGGCFGDFDKENFVNNAKLNTTYNCGTIPIRDQLQYGVIAGRVGISPFHQMDLAYKGLWDKVETAAVVPTVCVAMRRPTSNCAKATIAYTVNSDFIKALFNILPGKFVSNVFFPCSI